MIRKQDLTQPFPETAHEQLWGLWKHYLIVGGLPDAVNHYRERQNNLYEAVQVIRKTQRDLLEAYLADMAKHSGKTNALHIEKLWRNVPAQLARSQNGSAGKFKLREGIPGIRVTRDCPPPWTGWNAPICSFGRPSSTPSAFPFPGM